MLSFYIDKYKLHATRLTPNMTIEEFVPEQFCDGWGFYVDIESATRTAHKSFDKQVVKQPPQRANNTLLKTTTMPIPIPMPIPSTSCPKQPFTQTDFEYITLKSDRSPPMTLEDMINCTNRPNTPCVSTSYYNGLILTAVICLCLLL